MEKFFLNVISEGILPDEMLSSVRGGAASADCTCFSSSTYTCNNLACTCYDNSSYNSVPDQPLPEN